MRKSRQRSVAIQSTDFTDVESENNPITSILCKKTGFRDLLQKSVTIVSEENESKNVTVIGKKMARGVQATLGKNPAVHNQSIHDKSNLLFPESVGSETVRVVNRGSGLPGTSTTISSYSMYSQVYNMRYY